MPLHCTLFPVTINFFFALHLPHTLACDLLQYVRTVLVSPTPFKYFHQLHHFPHPNDRSFTLKAMKKPSVCVAAIVVILCCVPAFASARHLRLLRTHDSQQQESQPSTRGGSAMVAEPNSYGERRPMLKRKGTDTLQIAGSSLPDCSHACGSCTPCRLVMVSFVCASLEEAETCPMAYKCMCNNKSYPVP